MFSTAWSKPKRTDNSLSASHQENLLALRMEKIDSQGMLTHKKTLISALSQLTRRMLKFPVSSRRADPEKHSKAETRRPKTLFFFFLLLLQHNTPTKQTPWDITHIKPAFLRPKGETSIRAVFQDSLCKVPSLLKHIIAVSVGTVTSCRMLKERPNSSSVFQLD